MKRGFLLKNSIGFDIINGIFEGEKMKRTFQTLRHRSE
jgi:hypothetical protein